MQQYDLEVVQDCFVSADVSVGNIVDPSQRIMDGYRRPTEIGARIGTGVTLCMY